MPKSFSVQANILSGLIVNIKEENVAADLKPLSRQ